MILFNLILKLVLSQKIGAKELLHPLGRGDPLDLIVIDPYVLLVF